jgi:3D (Asp-Asp-Asp) domain-containing protein/peptidoglycan hydrolase CwlO-like protein
MARQPQMALWYVPALVRRPGRGLRTLCGVVLAGAAACATLASGGSAENAGQLERQADALRAENAELNAGAQSAATGLVTIERRLSQARAELASFRARAAEVKARRRAVSQELGIARSALRLTQRALARRLQALYEHGDEDTLAVVLGAGSLEGALNAIETMDLAATQDEDLIAKARSASKRLARLGRRLAARERELQQLAAARAAAAASLADARSERLQTIAALSSTNKANSAQIAVLDARARTLASVPPPTPAVGHVPGAPLLPPSGPGGVRSMTVVATGYALPGHTASGRRVGWGAVAVDPSVIPMGSRLSIPGYGLGVAADTGGAIRGARIDLWFPSEAHAHAWGSRVVTITVYPN